jgi:VanZ family protein
MLRAHQHWLPVILWMGFIFVMSTSLGSSAHTSRLIEPLIRLLAPGISPAAVDRVHFFIRKGGHLTEYAILALLVLRAVRISLQARAAGNLCKAAGIALLVSVAYAGSDEYHQSFVPGRTASVYDVMIDGCGAAAALAAALGWRKLGAGLRSG